MEKACHDRGFKAVAAVERIRAMHGWSVFAEFQRKTVFEKLEAQNAASGQ